MSMLEGSAASQKPLPVRYSVLQKKARRPEDDDFPKSLGYNKRYGNG
jgi:hypothetical protein